MAMENRFLQHIYVGRYGGLADRSVGPFGPGMNVVYGPNEAGKSTLSSLVGGVLFGWEEARGVRNTYRPLADGQAGERVEGRAGRLEWAARPEAGEFPAPAAVPGTAPAPSAPAPARSTLQRDEEAATGDASVTDDIDRATFEALFSLSADELRSLRGSSDVTARLLSAGSGTGTSPSTAFVEVEQRIVSATGDVLRLGQRLEDKHAEVKRAQEREQLRLQQDRELCELATSRAATAERIDDLNGEIENLVAWRAELDSLGQQAARRQEELSALRAELEEVAKPSPDAPKIDARLLALDSAEDRVLRDRLDEFAEEREKLERVADIAKENSATSTAAYEALMELTEEDVAESRRLRNRTLQAIVSVLLPIAFIAVGVPLFVHGREIASLSFTALGIGLVVIAVFLAAAAFYVLFRLPREGRELETRRQDAHWVMLQDRKKYDASLAEKQQFEAGVAAFFDEAGLAAAGGSIRQARTLLDEAAARRAELAAAGQRSSSLELRIASEERELAELAAERARITDSATRVTQAAQVAQAAQAAQAAGAPACELGPVIRARTAQRDALLEAGEEMGQRFGELRRELAAARDDRTFDQLKLEYHELRCRLRERKHELMELLLAKRMLERSITAWESQSQPEVYARAGRLLALITGGRWVEIAASPTGSLVAVAADGTARDPRHLSLGTCQQLYLALRIALLITADDVGKCVPVLADDILVNFDAPRRAGAARALEELARTRQVILFTCHEEVAALFPRATRIGL